jgi:hypothetical protein
MMVILTPSVIRFVSEQYGLTALMNAVRWSQANCVRALLDQGANVHATTKVKEDASAARRWAAMLSAFARIKLLLFF